MIERLQLGTSDGETLEARWDSPEHPKFTTIFCHPSPIDGGSMMAPLMIGVTQTLMSRGHAVLRFNFRGVGESSGKYGEGAGGQIDVATAVAAAMERADSLGITGWSFGAAMALNWLSASQSAIPYVGIAPPTHLLVGNPPGGPKRVILGTREQVIDPADLQEYCKEHGIDLLITPGDHFFHGRAKRIGNLVGEGLEVDD